MKKICCLLLVIPSALLLPGFLATFQISSTLLLVRTLSLSGLSSHCSLMSSLAASELTLDCMYISWSHEAIISGPHAQCTCLILSVPLQFIVLWCNVPSQGSFIVAYFELKFSSSSSTTSISGLIPLVHSLHLDHSLLWLCHW